MRDQCPRCGLIFVRIEGHDVGGLGVNTVLSIVAVLLVGAIGLIATFPELPLVPLTTVSVATAIAFPVLFYPFSKTVWTAIDLRLRPPTEGEVGPGYGEWIRP
jgi:hypothetical protein